MRDFMTVFSFAFLDFFLDSEGALGFNSVGPLGINKSLQVSKVRLPHQLTNRLQLLI
jgi:hypothetical protein